MCDAVWQPLEDGEDTFCSKACVAAYNAKLKAEHEDGLAGVPVEDEPQSSSSRFSASSSIIELWREQSSSSPVRGGIYANSLYWGAGGLLDALATAQNT